eukprot:Gregarina_sp_Poly_1__8365@NODE_48_length_17742_cov_51_152532_g42_i0_p12_GENE_NODE_48_length_17742_cov_51_152532_g42_i0NODE_48_length_17742_cov_51_152532_g42_i0_p12_ORF_typecomplete_len119_score8_79_NODE_48_length_17742_cov_51_152532_g42_i042764632
MSLVPRSAGSYFGRGRLPTLFRRPLYPAAPSHFTQTKTFQKFHGSQVDRQNAESFNITFIDKEGKEKPVKAWHGENVLEIAHENEIEVEGNSPLHHIHIKHYFHKALAKAIWLALRAI